MNPLIKTRDKYHARLLELDKDKKCGFCCLTEGVVIKEYKHWKWVYSEFPYWKYNTIIVAKQHKTKFHELVNDELTELKTIFIEAEKAYVDSGIMKNESNWGLDILWRQRVAMTGYETRAHIHVHLCPHQEGLFTEILDPDAHIIDITLLRSAIMAE